MDDTIGCGNKESYTLTDATGRRFEVKPKSFPKFELAGVSVKKTGDAYLANQATYGMTLRHLSLEAT